jgi:hypothetical protein
MPYHDTSLEAGVGCSPMDQGLVVCIVDSHVYAFMIRIEFVSLRDEVTMKFGNAEYPQDSGFPIASVATFKIIGCHHLCNSYETW